MIFQAAQLVKGLFNDGLTGLVDNDAIVIGQPSLPSQTTIFIYPGFFLINQKNKEPQDSEARTKDKRETLAIADPPAGPYILKKQPLEKSVLCWLIFEQGTVNERKELLLEDTDFSIGVDDQSNPIITFSKDISGASTILLKYQFVGVFTMREFTHDLLIDIFDSQVATQIQLGSLCTTIILTNITEIIKAFNSDNASQYDANNYVSTHSINGIHFLDGNSLDLSDSGKMQLRFQIRGQIESLKSITEGFGFIEKIKSPGKVSDLPIDIDVNVE